MKIALVNSKLDISFWLKYENSLAVDLKKRGHHTDISRYIAGLPSPLSYYDLAVTHPSKEDVPKFFTEVRSRSDFRVIIHSISPSSYDLSTIQDFGRVFSIGTILDRFGLQRLFEIVDRLS